MHKQQLNRVARLVAVLAILVGGMTVAVPCVQAATSPIHVPADAGWVDTGILVGLGQTVYLDVHGVSITAPLRSYPGAISGPDGQVWNRDCGEYEGAPPPCAMDGAPYGALVGRLGPSATRS